MTTKEVAEKFNVTEITVYDWCKKGYIRGLRKAADGSYDIPKSIKQPYTQNRSKGDAIYTSIVKATMSGFDVCAAIYDINDAEFNKYIEQLKEVKVIDTYVDSNTNIEYFCQTLDSSDFSKLSKNRVKKFLSAIKPNGSINIGVNIGNK